MVFIHLLITQSYIVTVKLDSQGLYLRVVFLSSKFISEIFQKCVLGTIADANV